MENLQLILSKCDHTLLKQAATFEEIKALCDEGIRYRTASVCIPPSHVKAAKEYGRNEKYQKLKKKVMSPYLKMPKALLCL